MNTSLLRVLAALFALTFIVAACASDTGSEWTFAPVAAQGGSPDEAAPAEEAVTQEQAGEAEPAEAAEAESEPAAEEPAAEEPAEEPAVEEPAAEEPAAEEPAAEEPTVAGEPRVIMLQADAALRFTDASGQQIRDIPVTPGETVRFQINNTAGFAHNFYIGTDEQLMLPSSTTDVGIPDWTTGVQELDWVVPEDITGLKFGCTVPGHYTLMQGTFSVGAAPPEEPAEEPAAEAEATTAPDEAAEPQEGQAAAAEDVRVIPLEADAALRFTQDGQQIREIPVTPGEKVIFRIDNTAGFAHNFYIGTNEELMVASATTDVGIPDWESGVMNLEWVVPDDITGLKFGCTVPGHYTLMQGDFVLSP